MSAPTLAGASAVEVITAALQAVAGNEAPTVVDLGVLNALGRNAIAAGSASRAAARVHVSDQAVLFGPFGGVRPACGGCLAIRWQRLRTRSERNALETGSTPQRVDVWPVVTDFAAEVVAGLWQWLSSPSGPIAEPPVDGPARVWRLDLETLQTQSVSLLPEPLCPSCGQSEPDRPQEWVWTSRPKNDPDDFRLRRPADYQLPQEALANPVCGVIGAVTGNDLSSPTTSAVAGSVLMRGYAGLNSVSWSGQSHSFRSSRDLAFLEGLERYSGMHRRRQGALVTGSYRALQDHALHPAANGLYDQHTYDTDPMVRPFSEDQEIPWVWGYSLRDERPILVPVRSVYYGAGLSQDNFVFECSNGCAIGSCLEEAVLFGLTELLERDAFVAAWYGRAVLPEIDLTEFRTGRIRSMVDRAALLGYDLRAYDNRLEFPVPVVTALAVRKDGADGLLSFAAGSGLRGEDAVEGALSEVLTYLPHLQGQVASRRPELELMRENFHLVGNLGDHAQLFGLPEMAEHAAEYLLDRPRHSTADLYADWEATRPRSTDLADDLRHLRDLFSARGFDIIVVDQTSPEQAQLGLSTVVVTVPGLLPIDFGWNRQRALHSPRLRSVLREAGLRDTDLAEHEIKRVPHPFP